MEVKFSPRGANEADVSSVFPSPEWTTLIAWSAGYFSLRSRHVVLLSFPPYTLAPDENNMAAKVLKFRKLKHACTASFKVGQSRSQQLKLFSAVYKKSDRLFIVTASKVKI